LQDPLSQFLEKALSVTDAGFYPGSS